VFYKKYPSHAISWQNTNTLLFSSSGIYLLIIWSGQYLKKMSYLSENVISILTWPIKRCFPDSKIVHNIWIPGSSCMIRMCSSGKILFISVISIGTLGMRDNWSATTFSTLFLSHISRSNSYKRRIHRISFALASFFVIRYFSAEWSINTVVLDPSRYCQNFSNANTTTKNFFSVVVIDLYVVQSPTRIIDHVLLIIDALS